jgi:hypothetical protein
VLMTDEEATRTYDELVEILRARRLDWLAQQVAREIAEGKSEITTLSAKELHDWGPLSLRRKSVKRAAEFTRVVPYSPKARLLKLIESIETTVLSCAAIEQHLARFVAGEQPFTIRFISDDAEGPSYDISEADLSVTPPAAEALRSLLAGLRGEIDGVD